MEPLYHPNCGAKFDRPRFDTLVNGLGEEFVVFLRHAQYCLAIARSTTTQNSELVTLFSIWFSSSL